MKNQSYKVLIIDDEPLIGQGCRQALTDQGHSAEVRLTAREGLAEALAKAYDVALVDLKLPDGDGLEVLQNIRARKPDVYCIIMTGFSTVKSAVEAMKLGAFDYLTKPFPEEELILAVERAMEKKSLVAENIFLRQELLDRFGFGNIVGENPNLLHIFEQIERVAPTDATVLLYGESGTGKELFARAIHAHSPRTARPFVAVDCGTLSPNLLESELFGHVKGAFTGAFRDKTGIFEMAGDGTLFLDDIANLTPEIQGKLLRVLEVHEFKPVGASHIKTTNARIIAATNRDLKNMVQQGSFREDLFYRLNVFPIFIPPLRERKDDIPRLAYFFLKQFSRKTGKRIEGFSDEALEMLVNYDWPGNVRQLKNIIERLVIMADRRVLDLFYLLDHLEAKISSGEDSIPGNLQELKEVKRRILEEGFGRIEKAFLIKALKACQGNISRAAERVGMQRPNFHALMKKHGVTSADLDEPKP